jgi:hypothetical protein
MSYSDDDLRGVGGWLAFLIIVLAVFTPLRTVVSVLQLFGDADLVEVLGDRWRLVMGLEIALGTVAVLGAWYLAWRLNSVHSWKTIRIVIPGLWLLALGTLFVELVLLSLAAGLPLAVIAEAVAIDIVRAFIFSGVWSAYLLKSVRVRNTYAEPEEAVSEVFV